METIVLEENDEDQVTASMDDGCLSISVLYKSPEETSVWLQDADAGVMLSPEGVVALREFLSKIP